MQNDPNAPYSDLELARLLTRRLRHGADSSQAPTVVPRPQYVRFDARRFMPNSEELAMTGRGQNFGADKWNQLLDDCISAAEADSAFLMEPQGLVVAARGQVPAEVAEGIGSRLMVALDQAELMSESGSGSVCVEFEGRWLTGVRFSSGGNQLTLGIAAPEPLGRYTRDVVAVLLASHGG